MVATAAIAGAVRWETEDRVAQLEERKRKDGGEEGWHGVGYERGEAGVVEGQEGEGVDVGVCLREGVGEVGDWLGERDEFARFRGPRFRVGRRC